MQIIFSCITLELSNVNGPKLQIKETVQDNTPNYELFDTMYIYIKATDLNQEVGKDYAEGKEKIPEQIFNCD